MSFQSIRNSSFAVLVALPALFLLPSAASAQLLGTSVTGQLLPGGNPPNFFDPANNGVGFGVPATGYQNSPSNFDSPTVPISATTPTFGFAQDVEVDTLITADFTNTGLTFTDVVNTLSSEQVPITFEFTDAAFSGMTLAELTDTFPGGLSPSLVGDVLTLSSAQIPTATSTTYTATYSLSGPAGTPEPGGIALLAGLGVTSSLFAARRLWGNKKP